jgi:pimeloyl-ACP methyl ester carboxylesterase
MTNDHARELTTGEAVVAISHGGRRRATPRRLRFHVEMGDPSAPVLLLIHGWASSIDWFEVAGQLSRRFRVCALDFPGYKGYGFSDKPQEWSYSLTRGEELIEFYLSEVIE